MKYHSMNGRFTIKRKFKPRFAQTILRLTNENKKIRLFVLLIFYYTAYASAVKYIIDNKDLQLIIILFFLFI